MKNPNEPAFPCDWPAVKYIGFTKREYAELILAAGFASNPLMDPNKDCAAIVKHAKACVDKLFEDEGDK